MMTTGYRIAVAVGGSMDGQVIKSNRADAAEVVSGGTKYRLASIGPLIFWLANGLEFDQGVSMILERYEQGEAKESKRVQDLLEANNRYQQEARDAKAAYSEVENELKDAVAFGKKMNEANIACDAEFKKLVAKIAETDAYHARFVIELAQMIKVAAVLDGSVVINIQELETEIENQLVRMMRPVVKKATPEPTRDPFATASTAGPMAIALLDINGRLDDLYQQVGNLRKSINSRAVDADNDLRTRS